MNGTFVVSLDFEQFWGMTGTVSFQNYERNILAGRKAIPAVLALFDRYGIHATWAVVGFQFAEDAKELSSYLPPEALRPSYQNMTSATYPLIEKLSGDEESQPCYFSPSLIAEIARHPNQEIGSHTFSHYYCREPGQTTRQFAADMEAAKKIGRDKGFAISSVVFPRDMSTPEHAQVLRQLGFTAYRDEADDWIHNKIPVHILRRALTLLDVYLPLTGFRGPQPSNENGIVRTVGNRQFRYYFKPLGFLEWAKVRRIKGQMKYAAKHGLSYHLWWHPHNLGDHTEALLCQLEDIFRYYKHLQQKYGMQSVNMDELAHLILK